LLQYGAYPPEGRMLRFASYRIGGGNKGNVGKNTITVLKSAIPYIAAVANAASAIGGQDGESLQQAMLRGPQELRARSRAVTAEVAVVARRRAVTDAVRAAIERSLYRFINPVHGGLDGKGWPWGRNLFNSEITAMVHQVEGVEYVEAMRLFKVDVFNNVRTPIDSALICPPNGLLASATHRVEIQ